MRVLLATRPQGVKDNVPAFMASSNWRPLRKLLGIADRSVFGIYPPLGLMYLASAVQSAGHDAKVLDGYFTSFEDIATEIRTGGYGLVGLSSYTHGWQQDIAFIEHLKRLFPETRFIVGGPHPNVWGKRCLEDCAALDFACCGEGEHLLRDLCTALEQDLPVQGIRGLVWRTQDGVHGDGLKAAIDDLDALPLPDRSQVDLQRYCPTLTNYRQLPATTIIGSRGCPFPCIFCHSIKKTRRRKVAHVLAEIDVLVNEYGIRDLTFYDETFTVHRKWAMELCDGLRERGYDLAWAANARADCLDRELVEKMAAAGCWRLLFGIESGSQRVLDILRKNTDLQQIADAVAMTQAGGIDAHGTFFFGTPGETFEEGLETIRFAVKLGLDYAAFGSLMPLPGTEVFDLIDDPIKYDFSIHSAIKIGYVPPSMTRGQMETLLRESYRSFYFRPRYIARRLAKIRSVEDLRRNAVGLLGLASL